MNDYENVPDFKPPAYPEFARITELNPEGHVFHYDLQADGSWIGHWADMMFPPEHYSAELASRILRPCPEMITGVLVCKP